MKFAYADPPYVGQAKRHYQSDEVDHVELITKLIDEYPDGWALSCSSPSLGYLHGILEGMGLSGFKGDYRTMAWVKPFGIFKPNVNPAYVWEPVIVKGGRKRTRQQLTVRDWVSVNITLKKGLSGVKPDAFSIWVFEVLNMQIGDEFHDLYLGSGAVTKAWDQFKYELLKRSYQGE